MRKITVWAEEADLHDGVRRRIRIESNFTVRRLSNRDIFFEVDTGVSKGLPLLDPYLAPMVMLAMRSRSDLHIKGSVSLKALRNAHEFQDAWHCWVPDKYQKREIQVDAVERQWDISCERAVQAFSGGVDAIFTAWRHLKGNRESTRYPLERAAFVHGFDISLTDNSKFSIAADKCRKILHPSGIDLSVVRTNIKEAIKIDWEHFHGSAIGCALGMFAPDYNIGLVASSGHYSSLTIPWGSSPLTDHLCSGAMMDIIHDGAGFTRNQKIAEIAQWSTAMENLRVCWEGEDTSKNCGVCEKCVRTALGFLAQGFAVPSSLKQDLGEKDIASASVSSSVQMTRFRELYELATQRGMKAPWVTALATKIKDAGGSMDKF